MRPAVALTYLLTAPALCFAGAFSKADLDSTEPFIVVHPTVYTGVGGDLTLSICGSSADTRPAIREAIAIWNDRQAMLGNCRDCALVDDPLPTPPFRPQSLRSTILHELGHCALGLGHSSWDDGPNPTSFTATQAATSISPGADMVPGSRDDLVTPLPGARLIHWFRIADNNPVVVDSTVIDESTYSRRILDLPSGSFWPASANRCVAEWLASPGNPMNPCPVPPVGTESTQAVMYTTLDPGTEILGLSADDVNTTALAMTGLDLEAGTADDYTVTLEYEENCALADVRVDYLSLVGEPGTLGVCISTIASIDPSPVDVHHRVVPFTGISSQLLIEINADKVWDMVFVDDFEEGTTGRWDLTLP